MAGLVGTLEGKLKGLGVPQMGHDWVVKALHPAAPGKVGVAIPDQSSAHTARPEYVVERVVSAPPELVADTWDCCIYTIPGNVTAVVVETGPAGSDFAVRATGTGPVLGGTATVLKNQEVVAVGTAAVDCTVWTGGTPDLESFSFGSYGAETRPNAWRLTYKSVTVYMTASSLTDQGTVTAGQFDGAPVSTEAAYPLWQTTPILGASTLVQYTVPLVEADMLLANPRCTVTAAREGVYIPTKYQGPDREFCQTERASLVVNTADNFKMCAAPATGPYIQGAAWTVSSRNGGPAVMNATKVTGGTAFGAASVLADDSFDHALIGVAIFRGLDPAASLTVKSIVGMEIAVGPESPVRAFVEAPVPPIGLALEAYFGVAAVTPDAYPSSANIFGAILPILASAAKFIAPWILPAVGAGAKAIAEHASAKSKEAAKRERKREERVVETARSRRGVAPPPAPRRGTPPSARQGGGMGRPVLARVARAGKGRA